MALAVPILCMGLVLPSSPFSPDTQPRVQAPAMVSIPRITLPAAVVDTIKEQDLRSPNDLTDAQYNTYSAAASEHLACPIAVPDTPQYPSPIDSRQHP